MKQYKQVRTDNEQLVVSINPEAMAGWAWDDDDNSLQARVLNAVVSIHGGSIVEELFSDCSVEFDVKDDTPIVTVHCNGVASMTFPASFLIDHYVLWTEDIQTGMLAEKKNALTIISFLETQASRLKALIGAPSDGH